LREPSSAGDANIPPLARTWKRSGIVSRGLIGTIIGVLVIIILVIVILQLT
jgi:tetrahydromethanopterin S-methyltransferase subunit F